MATMLADTQHIHGGNGSPVCPVCGAQPGERCEMNNGTPRFKSHRERPVLDENKSVPQRGLDIIGSSVRHGWADSVSWSDSMVLADATVMKQVGQMESIVPSLYNALAGVGK